MLKFRFYIHYFLIVAFFISLSLPISAQFNADFFNDTTQELSVSFNGDFVYGSTVMNNRFSSKFLFGGEIDRELKDDAYANLKANNRLGLDFNYRLRVEIPFDTLFKKHDISLLIGVESRDHVDAFFGEELFRLTFDGNKQFAGQTIDIGNTNYNRYKMQYLSVGFINYKKFETGIAKEGIIVNLIKGQQHEAITVPRGSLYTEQLGREINLDLNYIYNASDTSNEGALAFNGYGIGTDLFTEFFLKNGDKIYLGVQDLGFVYWNNNSLELSTDSSYSFDGIEVDNIFDLNDSIIGEISKDSIVDAVATVNKKDDYSIALPTAVNITYTKILSEKWKLNGGVYYKILSNYFPLFYLNTYYYFNDKFSVKTQIAYGGYGKTNIGLAVAKSFGTFMDIYIGTNNIEGLIIPDKAYSNSGFIGLKKYF